MAQLIKLEDCVSRYEHDVYRYTGQYTRLKRDRWQRVKANWENSQRTEEKQNGEDLSFDKKWWKRSKNDGDVEEIEAGRLKRDERTYSELKHDFREELFRFQLKWASATIRETSKISNKIKQDKFLRYLLKELPDNYLVLYKPVIQMKKAQTQLDVLLLGPDTIKGIVLLETAEGEVIHASQDRFWECERQGELRKVINPTSAIQRMNFFIESVIDTDTTELNITYSLLAKNAYINRNSIPSYIQVIDQTNYGQWTDKLKRQPSPIKYKQLKAAKTMLEHCVTTAYARPEWDTDENRDYGQMNSE